MLDITILTIGKVREKFFISACDNYLKRLKPYARIKIEELKSEAFSSATKNKAKIEEAKKLQAYLNKKNDATIFVLAEKGIEMDSLAFAENLKNINGPIIFVIGGALGFTPEFFAAYKKMSLSKLTFPHEMARVILLEQLYRASTIINNKEYHY